MCITFFHLSNKSRIRFMIAFNRDQDQGRQTLPFGAFQDDSNIYAGRDVLSGGSWLGINVKTGIMVILTNYKLIRPRVAKSRGLLVRFFLQTKYLQNESKSLTPGQLSTKIHKDMTEILQNHLHYSAFNMSVYNIRDNKIFYMCSEIKMKQPMDLKPEMTHGYSNTDINTMWAKVERGKKMFGEMVERIGDQGEDDEEIFRQMEKIMKNSQGTGFLWKYFQPSIFIPMYYSFYMRKNRMTKSTFYAIFSQNKEGHIDAHIREVSYFKNNQQKKVEFNLTIQ